MSESTTGTLCSGIKEILFTYTTIKEVKVPNTKIAIINRLLQLVIFAYIAIYIVWWKQGYQAFQEPHGSSIIKVKGIAKVAGVPQTGYIRADTEHLWDIAEYQIPPLENNAFFLVTRQTVTYNQSEDYCPSALIDQLFCNETAMSNCLKDRPTPNTFGYFTGNCVLSRQNDTIKVCEIKAWCPEEMTDSIDYIMNSDDLENFTVYLKTVVTFGLFNITLRNVRNGTNFTCLYHPTNNPSCPILRIGDILQSLNTNKTTLLSEGGLIEIRQDWTCNFDYSVDRCYPKLDFKILQSGDEQPSPGVNYRFAQKYRVNETDYRTLTKAYGLRFVVTISGQGGQFDIVNLFVAIGSGIGFMAIASVVCDAIFMYIHRSREHYRERKFSICEVKDQRPDENGNENLKLEILLESTNSDT